MSDTTGRNYECDNDDHDIGCQCPGLPHDYWTKKTTGTGQPEAGAVCPACSHFGADHLRIGDLPPRCRCGCVDWDSQVSTDRESARYLKAVLDLHKPETALPTCCTWCGLPSPCPPYLQAKVELDSRERIRRLYNNPAVTHAVCVLADQVVTAAEYIQLIERLAEDCDD